MVFEVGMDENLDLCSWQDMGWGTGEVSSGMGTIFKDVEIEMSMSFHSFIQRTPIKQLFGAKHLSKNR